jgi:hypothetical protein
VWAGGIAVIVLGVLFVAAAAQLNGWLKPVKALPVAAAAGLIDDSPGSVNRTSCAEFGTSDLGSPAEGVWFQANCTGSPAASLEGSRGECNRTSLDPSKFAMIAPGLYVFNGPPASRAFLWYASAENCFSLVSGRVVTVVCADQTVSFRWSDGACAVHGGVLARVNAP